MENIKFEVTEKDIKEYLKRHKDDKDIKYKEAIFIKYIKEKEILTKEKLEMLMKKYNLENVSISGVYDYDNHGVLKRQSLQTFTSYLDGINNLDISGICHIMIPVLTYYNIANKRIHVQNELSCLVERMGFETKESIIDVRNDTVENYRIAYGKKIENWCSWTDFNLSKETSKKMLQEYVSIYGEESVKIIKKTVRERV